MKVQHLPSLLSSPLHLDTNTRLAVVKEKHLQEEDIDSILQRATTITYDSAHPRDSLGNGFNKATFVMNENTTDVDLDDADFWSKILPEVCLVFVLFFFFCFLSF